MSTTTSIGLATYNGVEGDFDGVLSRADRALYEAKRLGRYRVCLESDPGNV